MTLYSIGESATIIGIERGHLKGWFDGGFIKATEEKKWGKGTKKLLDSEKLYEAKVFHKLTMLGFSRETASERLRKISGHPLFYFSNSDMIRLKRKSGKVENISMSMGKVHLVGDGNTIKKIMASPDDQFSKDTLTQEPLDSFDEVVFVNIKEIRKEVDRAIKKFEAKKNE